MKNHRRDNTTDRLAIIKAAAEKVQKGKNIPFRSKLKTKSRRAVLKATADARALRVTEAFDERVMHSSESEVREYADSMGISDTYRETLKFDDEWN